MKLVSSRRKWNWSSSAKAALLLGLVLAAGSPGQAADEGKDRVRYIRDLARQGSGAVTQIAPYVSDPDQGVRLAAVRAIVDLATAASLDPLVKATADNSLDVQLRAVEGLVNFYLPGYVDKGMTAPFKKFGTAVKSRFTDTNDQIIDAYVQVRPDIITAVGKVARGGVGVESRAAAARALGVLRGRAALPDLLQTIQSNDADVNYEALIALQKIRDRSAGPGIVLRLRDPSEKVQLAAIETTGLLTNRSAINQLRDAMDRSKSIKVKRAALTALALMPEESTRGVFLFHLGDKDEAMRVAAVEGLARMHTPSDLPALEKSWNDDKKPAGRMAAAFGLVNEGRVGMTDFDPLRYLVNQLNSAGYRGVATAYLTELGRDPAARTGLHFALQNGTPTHEEQTGLAQVLAECGDRESIAVLEVVSKDVNPDVGKEALRAIQTIRARGGQ